MKITIIVVLSVTMLLGWAYEKGEQPDDIRREITDHIDSAIDLARTTEFSIRKVTDRIDSAIELERGRQ